MVGRYDNPIPTRFLVPIDCSKIPAQARLDLQIMENSLRPRKTLIKLNLACCLMKKSVTALSLC